MYAEKLKQFENAENLGGKAWEHAVMIDCAEKTSIKDCSMHCFHFQQMFELLFKHLLETRSEYGAFPRTHKLDSLLELIIRDTHFKTDIEQFSQSLVTVTVCAEAYRYNFLLNCKTYWHSVEILNILLDELIEFAANGT
jgi:hypothetical protein